MNKILLVVAFLLQASIVALAQEEEGEPQRRGSRIIDDTTKQIYGPRTSSYFYEEDVFYNRSTTHFIDTAIQNFHRYNYVDRYNNFNQDLGSIGTAINPVFYRAPSFIGVRAGHEVFDPYWYSERIRYFDTKSPYTVMNVILGGKGRSITRATYSRNIHARWNFGLTYRGFFIDKQVPERVSRGDRVTGSNYYDMFTSYASKDSTYRLFANFQRMFHRVFEPGGVRLRGDSSFRDYFDPEVQVWLNAAESNDLRMNVHVQQVLKIGTALQLYHSFDRYRQKNKFLDTYATDQDFFPFRNYDSASTSDATKFRVVRNEAGIKGNLLKFFYNGYVAARHFKSSYYKWPSSGDFIYVPLQGAEKYIGGRMELNLDSIGLINGWAEVNTEGNYRVEGRIVSRWFDAMVRQMLYKPSYIQQAYYGAHHQWNNDFANVESSELNGYLHYRSKNFNLSPGLTFTRLRNYVFYDQTSDVDTVQRVFPVQSSGNQVLFAPEVRFSVRFLNTTFSGQVIQSSLLENADEAIRVPSLFVNSQLAYANIFFNGNLDMQTGVDVHWKSAYYAPGYDPAIRQFYNQDVFKVNAYPVVDVFFNARIKRGRIFVKLNNAVQLIKGTGYFPTPYYPGQRTILDFGFDWSFYD